MDYKKIFNQIVSDIEANPYLELIVSEFNEGLNAKELSKTKIELYDSLGYFKNILLNPIFDFYSQYNGLKIKWKISSSLDDKSYDKLLEDFTDWDIPNLDNKRDLEVGSINILPFEDVFIYEQDYFDKSNPDKSNSDDFFTHFGNHIYEGNSFGQLLFLFDLYSDTDCMSFVADEDNQELKVIQLSDYYIVWDNSKISYFESYVNFLAATRGSIISRKRFFEHYRGDKVDPLVFDTIPYDTEIEPTIFKI